MIRVRLADWFQVPIYQDLGVVVTVNLRDSSTKELIITGNTTFNETDKLRYVTLYYCGDLKEAYLEALINDEEIGNSPKHFSMISGPFNMSNTYLIEYNGLLGCQAF